jgi:hypothetical protein
MSKIERRILASQNKNLYILYTTLYNIHKNFSLRKIWESMENFRSCIRGGGNYALMKKIKSDPISKKKTCGWKIIFWKVNYIHTSVLKKKWVWVLSFNSKLTENELLNSILKPKTHQKWVTRLKLRLKTHWKWDLNSILKLIFFWVPMYDYIPIDSFQLAESEFNIIILRALLHIKKACYLHKKKVFRKKKRSYWMM